MTQPSNNRFGPDYASLDDPDFIPKYRAACFCGRVRYEVSGEPVDAKLCHCRVCQQLHGAPVQWAAIFHKHQVRFTAGLELLCAMLITLWSGGSGSRHGYGYHQQPVPLPIVTSPGS